MFTLWRRGSSVAVGHLRDAHELLDGLLEGARRLDQQLLVERAVGEAHLL